MDPAQALFLQRETESVNLELMERRQKPLNAARLFPADGDIPIWALTHTRKMQTSHGRAAIVNERGTNLPIVGIGAVSGSYKVKTMGCAFQYTEMDATRAQAMGIPLERTNARAAERAMDELRNDIEWYGDSAHGLIGVVTNPYFPRVPLAKITSGTAVATLIAWVTSVISATRNLQGSNDRLPTNIVFADGIYDILGTARLGDTEATVISYLLRMQREKDEPVTFASARELTGAGPNGENLVFAWNADPEVASRGIPGREDFRPFPPQVIPGTFGNVVVACRGMTSGFMTWRPLEAVIGVEALE